jgi:hypothetical protein
LLGQTYTPAATTVEAIENNQEIQTTTTTQTPWKETVAEFGNYALNGLFIFVAGMIFLIMIKNMLRFFYDVFNSHRIIYLKVLLPRGQSKLDREQDKELAKDMKEKIGRMSQVFHNFHKV